ncbi:unnamed protein product [Arctia plantaginis]|uniref:Uncharacterized protein n=1 Tax=Arctia plantaginis TaxID=874455 RepID=A0A8S0Z535_ARCPL|nr:unnamed protein product [Arctia plantaginis]
MPTNTSSAQIRSKSIFPNMLSPGPDKADECPIIRASNGYLSTAEKSKINGVLNRKEHSSEYLAENMESCEVSEEIEFYHIDLKVNMYLNGSNSVDDHCLVEERDLDTKDTIIIKLLVLHSTYHHARLFPIGSKTLCVKNDSLSSDSGCNQNSSKYPHSSVSDISSDDNSSSVENNMVQSEMIGVLYRKEHSGEYLADHMEVKVCDEIESHHIDIKVNMYLNGYNSVDDHRLVEGRDFDTNDTIIIIVNPNSAVLDSSSKDDEEEYVTEKYSLINNDSCTSYINQDGEDEYLESFVNTNVDEYAVKSKNSEQHIIKHKFPKEDTTQFRLPYSSNTYCFITYDDKPSQEHFIVGAEPLLPESENDLIANEEVTLRLKRVLAHQTQQQRARRNEHQQLSVLCASGMLVPG